MVASVQHTRSAAVTIDVADAERSRAFYAAYFGLRPIGGDRAVLGAQPEGGVAPVTLRLRERARVGMVRDLDIEVDDGADVLDLYLLLMLCGVRASLPRASGGRVTTVVHDPDGHRVAVWARAVSGQESRREQARGVHGWMRPGTSPRRHERGALRRAG